jgi:putative transposase
MMLAHKIALDPTDKQRSYFVRASGTARFAYNWALAEWKRQHAVGGKPSEVSLRRQLNSMKREQYPWMFDVTKCAAQEAIIDLGTAFRTFFEKRGKYPRFKYPRFKKKGTHDSFCAANEAGTFRCESKRIKLPVIGWVRMREAVRFQGPFKRVTVSREADRWFASIMVETSAPAPVTQPNEVVGVDLGVSVLATLSQGEPIVGPKAHTALLKRLRRSNRALSRKKRGSRNAARAKRRLAKLHARIANIRKDVTHKATTALAKGFRRIGIEDLNVQGMARNRRLARSIMDGGFFEFRRQLDDKARLYGASVVVADRWFPSSKTCSCCGSVKAELDLSQRVFRCGPCGFVADRDCNAAKNLERLAASSAVSACGEARSGAVRKSRVKRASKKQEPNGGSQLCAA